MNKIIIVYASKHSTTEKVAQLLSEKLIGKVALVSLKQEEDPDISAFETVILGTSIYAGKPLGIMTKFCKKNQDTLLQKTTGLFVCGMQHDPNIQNEELINAYPHFLHQHAKATGFLGGEFLFGKLNFFEKVIIKRVSKVTDSVSSIDINAIEKFAKDIQL